MISIPARLTHPASWLLLAAAVSIIPALPDPSVIAAVQNLAPQNAGFEQALPQGIPGWHPDSLSRTACSLESANGHSGAGSLCIRHATPRQSAIYSDPLSLEVGKLYRLSGWIRTERALTDSAQHYPTPVPACLRISSMPITSYSRPVGGDQGWQRSEAIFFASQASDRIELHLGYRGGASGTAWFDDIEVTPVDDITEFVPAERIRRHGKAFRFEEQGWTFLHIEGAAYPRGFQYGTLVAQEIKTFINKLAISRNKDNPAMAWRDLRSQVDLLFLRKYKTEFLEEMQGIADGAKKEGVTLFDRPIELLDIVTINSYVDLSYAYDAVRTTPHALSGQRFKGPEDQLDLPERLHKCSSFLANGSATEDHRIVFGQLFMWNGYMGPEWDLIVDLVPEKGQRLVYETFPGGIHSGADFYINESGIMIGETTVSQTPWNPEGTPQSNRIRLAAQYARSIDDVVKLLTTHNNGMYTNDWLIGDCKNDEIAVYCLGTNTAKLWRSSRNEFYDGQKDWYWSDNNPKSLDIRKEYIANPDNAPFDLGFRPWDRDMAFFRFYEANRGRINARVGMELIGSSPTNRPHACDGKITTSAMAEKMMFMAHYGKVTYREQFINENGRIPDLPMAIPRLSLGYTTFAPLTLTRMIADLQRPLAPAPAPSVLETAEVDSFYQFPTDLLWANTVYPASPAENWLVSGTAAYWQMLNALPKDGGKARTQLCNDLAELNCRLLYTQSREGTLAPVQARENYHQTKYYYIPRSRGTFLLHQLRLQLGNLKFSALMNRLHDAHAKKEITNARFIEMAREAGGPAAVEVIEQWIQREDLPDLMPSCRVTGTDSLWHLTLRVEQKGRPFLLIGTVRIRTSGKTFWKKIELREAQQEWDWPLSGKPVEVILNAGNDFPMENDRFYTFSNFYDDWDHSLVVYGTTRQIEANHTLALRFAKAAADRITETTLPVRKDCEFSVEDFRDHDVILL
ncbi:MAG TPA: C45 family autoproteolytic acyltransferase/hydrolase, partial [bacterium]|nr:C45 family autoproteolytic acyltransferase/hydrolase [bacterium]